jgi:hypothetical protein
MALVRSQLYSFSFSTFSEEEYERSQKIFLQSVFSLPPSFPIHLACFLLAVPEYALSLFDARIKFISRLARIGSIASLSAMAIDREELLPLGLGWNFEFLEGIKVYLDIHEIDLLDEDEVGRTRGKLVEAMLRRRVRRMRDSSSRFMLDFFPNAVMPVEFALFLKNLPFESVRILLIFFSNQFQYTYLRSTNLVCPFCSMQMSSEHLFLCQHTPPPYNDWSSLRSEFVARDYWKAVDRLFLTLQRWASISGKFVVGFAEKVMEYFQYTESQVVRRNADLLAVQMQVYHLRV